jgi:hypothetical protein
LVATRGASDETRKACERIDVDAEFASRVLAQLRAILQQPVTD